MSTQSPSRGRDWQVQRITECYGSMEEEERQDDFSGGDRVRGQSSNVQWNSLQ